MGEVRSFGYVRVSSKEQNEARQTEALKGLDIQERDLFIDKQSGKDFDRPRYQALKMVLRKSDVLFIKELDRLGRNAEEIKREWKEITQDIGANIVILDMAILDTRQYKNGLENVITNIVLELLSYMAEREKEKINSRQAEGIATAKASGVRFGRPKHEIGKDFIAVYDEWKAGEITAVEAMRRVDMKPNTFYRRANEIERERASS
jgi:DNA invertase Pin-like site-specific DNA recombinase